MVVIARDHQNRDLHLTDGFQYLEHRGCRRRRRIKEVSSNNDKSRSLHASGIADAADGVQALLLQLEALLLIGNLPVRLADLPVSGMNKTNHIATLSKKHHERELSPDKHEADKHINNETQQIKTTVRQLTDGNDNGIRLQNLQVERNTACSNWLNQSSKTTLAPDTRSVFRTRPAVRKSGHTKVHSRSERRPLIQHQ